MKPMLSIIPLHVIGFFFPRLADGHESLGPRGGRQACVLERFVPLGFWDQKNKPGNFGSGLAKANETEP
jgi:hypothetical protein